MQKANTASFCVKGMHCASCDILVKQKLGEVPGIKDVSADHTDQSVTVTYEGALPREELERKLAPFGYTLLDPDTNGKNADEPYPKRIVDAVAIGMIFTMLYLVAGELNVIPALDPSGGFSLSTVFLIGLIASVSTCMATTGALYLATIGKMATTRPPERETDRGMGPHRMVPALSFNLGRILTYTVFGAINGLVGKVVSQDLQMGSALNLIVAICMILIGLDMLRILPLAKLLPDSFVKNLFVKIENRLLRNPRRTSFLLGVSTYWLPCGFTQSVQLYALSVADPLQSAAIMLAFALGTTPALMVIGYASSFIRTQYYAWFMKAVGVFVVLVGTIFLVNYLNLTGAIPFASVLRGTVPTAAAGDTRLAPVEDGVQILRMTVDNRGYSPASFTVKRNVPVKWLIDGKQVLGCQGQLIAPKLGIDQVLEPGENVFTFTPAEAGVISFSCSSGSSNGRIEVIEG
jgi:sulfite exporter TauE/SafE/copper chaperone CopZ